MRFVGIVSKSTPRLFRNESITSQNLMLASMFDDFEDLRLIEGNLPYEVVSDCLVTGTIEDYGRIFSSSFFSVFFTSH